MVRMKCKDCIYFSSKLVDKGIVKICRAEPPKAFPVGADQAGRIHSVILWPQVDESDFCGYFDDGKGEDDGGDFPDGNDGDKKVVQLAR